MIGTNLVLKPHPNIAQLITEGKTTFSDVLCIEPFQISLASEEFERVHNHFQLKEPLLFQDAQFELLIERYQMMRTQILSREGKHHERLTQLAIETISEIYDIPEDQIKWNVNFNLEGLIDPSFEDDEELNIDPERIPFLEEQIKKRKILNALVHGSSMHIWKSCHHLVSSELKRISPILPLMYDSYTAILGFCIWQSLPDALQQGFEDGTLMTQGINRITFDQKENPNIEVEAINFPAMLHEVNKGVIDLIICHGLPEDVTEDELKYIYQKADRYQDEYWHYVISPSIWARLLKFAKTKTQNLPEIIMEISLLDFEQLETLMRALCENSDRTEKLLIKYGIIN